MAFRWALALSLVVMASTVLPYAYHAARPVPGKVYSGIEAFPVDTVTYLMWISQARRGDVLCTDLYTVEGTDRMLPNPLWAAVGLIGRMLPGEAVTLYHGARVLLGVGYPLLLWAFVRRVHTDALTQWTAWLLTVLGGGMAWVYSLHTGSTDLKGMWVTADFMPEMWSYSSLLYFPHFAAGLLLLVGSFHCACGAWLGGRRSSAALGGVLLGLLALVHTYTAVTAVVTLLLQSGVWMVVRRRWRPVVAGNVLLLFASAPFFMLQAWQVHVSPTMQKWAESNLMPSPTPLSYLLGIGLPGIAALAGLAVTVAGLWREGMEDASEHRGGPETPGHQEAVRCLLVAWVLATVVLISSGVAFERRCIEGFHIALALLAAPLVVGVARRACARRPRQIALCVGGFIALSCPTALWYAAREYPSQMGYINPDLMPAEAAIYRWMGDGAVVLARPDASLWLPTRGRVRVYAGHPQLTLNAHAKSHTVRRFFSPETTPAERAVMFGNTGCNLVAATGSDTALLARDRTHWVQVLSVGSVAVFERTHSPGVGPFLARRQGGVEAFACAGAPLR